MPVIKTAISIGENLFEETDAIAQEMKIPRSRLITLALQDYIRRYRNKQMLEKINQAFEDPPTVEEKESLEIIRSQQRKLALKEGTFEQ